MDFLSRLGIAYRNGQRMDDALRTLQQAYHERSVCLGTDHINTLQALNHLAVTYQYAGQPQQAARLLEELRDRRARVLGPDHEDTTCAIIDLARVYLELGRWDEALPLFQSALETRRRIQGPDHYATLIAIDSLAMAFLQMGRFGEAEPLCRESLRLRESKLGPGHPETIDARLNLVRVLIEWSWSQRDDPTTPGAQVSAAAMRAREAERLCRSSLTDEEQLGPAADLRRFKTQTLLGSALVVVAATGRDLTPLSRIDKLGEAEALLLAARNGRTEESAIGPAHEKANLISLVRLYETWDKLTSDTSHGKKAAQWRQQLKSLVPPTGQSGSEQSATGILTSERSQ